MLVWFMAVLLKILFSSIPFKQLRFQSIADYILQLRLARKEKQMKIYVV